MVEHEDSGTSLPSSERHVTVLTDTPVPHVTEHCEHRDMTGMSENLLKQEINPSPSLSG